MKKLIAMLLVLAMALGLAACTAKPNETQAPQAGGDNPEVVEPSNNPDTIVVMAPPSPANT